MATKTRLTPEQRLAKLDAERAKIAAAVAAKSDPERPEHLEIVIAIIKKYAFTKKEIGDAWPRQMVFKARGPRKAKVAA